MYSGLDRVSVIGTGGSTRKSLFVNISHIFAYFPHFTTFSCVEQTRNLSFRLK